MKNPIRFIGARHLALLVVIAIFSLVGWTLLRQGTAVKSAPRADSRHSMQRSDSQKSHSEKPESVSAASDSVGLGSITEQTSHTTVSRKSGKDLLRPSQVAGRVFPKVNLDALAFGLPNDQLEIFKRLREEFPDVDWTEVDPTHQAFVDYRGTFPLDLDEESREIYAFWLKDAETMSRALVELRAQDLGLSVGGVENDQGYFLSGFKDGEASYVYTTNVGAASTTGASFVRWNPGLDPALGATINGGEFYVNINDHGEIYEHTEFQLPNNVGSRIMVKETPWYAGNRDHMVHVAGTVAGWGYNSSVQGMAPRAWIRSLIQQSGWHITNFAMATPGQLMTETNPRTGKLQMKSVVGNTSLGSGPNSRYTSTSASYDSLMRDHPYYVHCFSAGNSGSGFETIGAPWSSAKNVFAIGAAYEASRNASGSYTSGGSIASFSSRGPTYDGRIKPDFVGKGVSVNSTVGETGTGYKSGTSMSSPNVAGSVTVLMDYVRQRLPQQYLRSATYKALLVNTTDDLGNPGPDYTYGWGLVNVHAAAKIIREQAENPSQRLIMEESLAPSQTWTETYTSDGTKPLRVSIAWLDPAGTANADGDHSSRLINDLDLRIIGPTGTVHSPYVMPFTTGQGSTSAFDASLYNAHAVNGDNITDPVEHVYIAAPPAGTYTVRVTHKGALKENLPQLFSVAVSGIVTAPPLGGSIAITCDNGYDLYLNGALVGTGNNWQQSRSFTNLPLVAGANVIAVKGTDSGGIAALLAELVVDGQRSGTSTAWKVSLSAPANWNEISFNDSGWAAAKDYGAYGVSPWSKNVSGMPGDTPARWIWSSNNDADNVVYFRHVFTVGPPNTAPVAIAQNVSTPQGTAKAITLTGSDAEGDPLSYTIVSQPLNGTLGGTPPYVTYTPSAGYSGSDSFTFKVNDGKVDSAPATISIQVTSQTGGIVITCDNGFELYLNGTLVGTGNVWEQARQFTNLPFVAGPNVIAVKGTDAGGIAALLAELSINGQRSGTSTAWKVSLTAPAGWNEISFNDSGWAAAKDYGAYGVSPWSKRVSGMPGDTPARWIWSSNNDADNLVYFRHVFNVGPVDTITPTYTTRGDGYTVATFTAGSGTWTVPQGVTSMEVLVIGGGGGGGTSKNFSNAGSGGGGAGGMVYIPSFAVSSGPYSIDVGSGGAGAVGPGHAHGVNGDVSKFGALTALGGGGGAGGNSSGRDGGSGGGSRDSGFPGGKGLQPLQAGPSGTYGYGNNGATGSSAPGSPGYGGGGAGAVAPGIAGGAGKAISITGSSLTYAGGGGGGGAQSSAYGAGGSGGGGAGGNTSVPAKAGLPNTGGGGGGGNNSVSGANGGSGVVIVAYRTSSNELASAEPTVEDPPLEPFAEWAACYDEGFSGCPISDDDGDGMNNFHEFAFGLDPMNANSSNPIVSGIDAATRSFRYTRSHLSGLTYTVLVSTNLVKWTAVDVDESVSLPDANGVVTVEATLKLESPPEGGNLFMRVKAD